MSFGAYGATSISSSGTVDGWLAASAFHKLILLQEILQTMFCKELIALIQSFADDRNSTIDSWTIAQDGIYLIQVQIVLVCTYKRAAYHDFHANVSLYIYESSQELAISTQDFLLSEEYDYTFTTFVQRPLSVGNVIRIALRGASDRFFTLHPNKHAAQLSITLVTPF